MILTWCGKCKQRKKANVMLEDESMLFLHGKTLLRGESCDKLSALSSISFNIIGLSVSFTLVLLSNFLYNKIKRSH